MTGMTLHEWHAQLASEPATPNQIGAVLREFGRLGLGGPADRAERLALSAILLGLDGLDSTRHLVMGDAGRLVRLLGEYQDAAELRAAAAAVSAARTVDVPAPGRGLSMSEALTRALALVLGVWQRPPGHSGTCAEARSVHGGRPVQPGEGEDQDQEPAGL